MKITLCIPEGKDKKSFVNKELNSCRNIKDKNTMKSVYEGLKKISQQLIDGKIYLWDGFKLEILDYKGTEFVYHCGDEFKLPDIPTNSRYGMIVMDANECTIAELRGKRIVPLWSKKSNVPRKQDAGGQSAKRFQRNRELALNQWYKEIAHKMKELWLAS